MKIDTTIIETGVAKGFVYYRDSKNARVVGDGKIQLILTSPPFHYFKDYSNLSNKKIMFSGLQGMSDEIYRKHLSQLSFVLKECVRVLSENGVLILVVAFLESDSPKRSHPFPLDLTAICEEFGLGLMDVWIYRKTSHKLSGSGLSAVQRPEFILVFSKNNSFKRNSESAEHAEGTAVSALWEFELPSKSECEDLIYCPFPDGLVDRAIRLFTDKGDWVMDPFLGSGKTVARALALERNAIGFEINPKHKKIIKNTISLANSAKNELIQKDISFDTSDF